MQLFRVSGLCSVSISLIIIVFLSSCRNQHSPESENDEPIDRYALVNRHNILVEEFDSLASLSVGNGNFAFTTGITGLQTFYKEYENGVSLGTMSNWGWHSIPNEKGFKRSETYLYHNVKGHKVPYEHQVKSSGRAREAVDYFRSNPHRLHLGIIRLKIIKNNGQEMALGDVQDPMHRLDLWKGGITSDFEVEGEPVKVKVFAHQDKDMISAKVESPLIKSGQLSVEWLFPYGVSEHTHPGYDFDSPGKHSSVLNDTGSSSAIVSRKLDNDSYSTGISWDGSASLQKTSSHRFELTPDTTREKIEFSCLFSPSEIKKEWPGFESTKKNNEEEWKKFWTTGGAVDFSSCSDPRAEELERRTVLSQYLTKINGSGELPPQETGLTFNSWFGKFHLEMHWWHSAHYYNWQREENMAPQFSYYRDIFLQARKFTRLQGYDGVRWPKMVGPEGKNSPSAIGSYLIWQQPHLIYLAEQLYQANPSSEILQAYSDLIFATADFMADFAVYDAHNDVYELKPPLIPAQEHWNLETTENPPFELAYWHWGLTVAQKWKERLGGNRDPKWEEVRNKLHTPVVMDSVYLGVGNALDSYATPENMRDHPMVLGTLGMLPLWDEVDPEIMRNTLNLIMNKWEWAHTWGWDYPMVAMCATRLNEPEIAIEVLLKDVQKNTYLVNGHNYQDENLRIYLPGNGGFLKAIALMCAGWEGCETENPGFPEDESWEVRWENLNSDF